MKPTPVPRVKVCCISSEDEARLAIRYGADAIGLVSAMPSGPGVISDERIRDIARAVPPPVATFLLTSEQQPGEIVAQQRQSRTTAIQLCDRVTDKSYRRLRGTLPNVALIQVVHVTGPEAVDEAERVAAFVDAVLLDSGRPDADTKELGGTGRTHDWQVSRRIRDGLGVPVFLAGGLNTGNVAEAIEQVEPFALDLCSGVRTDGQLDEDKLRRFFARLHEATHDRL